MKVIDIKYSAIDNKYSITPQDNLSEASHNLDKSSTMWNEVLDGVEACVTTQPRMGAVATDSDTTSPAMPKNVAVVVYSLSEVILTVGFAEARNFIRILNSTLLKHVNRREGLSCDAAGSSTAVTSIDTTAASASSLSSLSLNSPPLLPCIVLSIHQTLHSGAELTQLMSLGTIIVRVVPNTGTLSNTVAAEIQSIRRSTTGKISESIEMFGCDSSLLYPIKPIVVPTNTDKG
eukprot:CAMPEP_0170411410 /NCGR_PEP_ID=MMETSP0117_2-20130122/30410_1 /TAXON_ID=400756 /ORGANISM="Durinskia baltica, Strain CSIRO CS-38" /LENGTH=232 /DNA_ID=CAMNT_0010669011 /DNA_START=248 /DNA_END=942 /DNA_ORIENTATION=-